MTASAPRANPTTSISPLSGIAAARTNARPQAHVVALLPRGEVIRNMAQAGVLDRVREDAQLTVLSVMPDRPTFDQLVAKYGRVLPLQETVERYPVRLLRELLDMAHGRKLWSAAAQERWRLRDAEAITRADRLKRFGRKTLSLPFASRAGVEMLSWAERATSKALNTNDSYTELYRAIRPTLVFNGSHVHSKVAVQAVQSAQWLGIPTAAFIFSWDNLTSQGRILPAYDYYLVWNDDLKAQLLNIYPEVKPDRVFVTGTPQFDLHFDDRHYLSRDEFCATVRADPARPIVLYSTGMAEHMPGEPLIVEEIANLLQQMTDLGPPQLLVRVYPKDRSGRFEELKARRTDILFPEARWIDGWLTPTEDDNRMLTNTLRHVDAGINVASTISLELCMFDKPAINVAYNPPGMQSVRVPYARYYEYDHYRPIVASGAIELASSADEMRSILRAAIANPSRRKAERHALMNRMFGDTLDGRSHERVARVLTSLAAPDTTDEP